MNENTPSTPNWLDTAEHCYWAVLQERCGAAVSRKDRIRLDFAFEGELPMPIEEVITAYAPLDEHRTLACAVDRNQAPSAVDAGALVLRPDNPPEFVQQATPDINSAISPMNFLTGHAAPRPVQRSKVRVCAELAAVVGLVTGILLFGMHQRVNLANKHVQELNLARQTAIEDALPGVGVADELALLSELRQLERSRAPGALPTGLEARRDITPALAHALQHWPSELHARTRRLSTSSGQLQLQTEVDAIEESEQLAQALARSEHWNAGVPRVESQGRGGFLATITLEPEPGSVP